GETYDRPIYPAACGGALARSALGRVRAHCVGTGRGAWERSRELPARSRPPGDGQASTPSRKRRSTEDDGTNDVQRWTPRTSSVGPREAADPTPGQLGQEVRGLVAGDRTSGRDPPPRRDLRHAGEPGREQHRLLAGQPGVL